MEEVVGSIPTRSTNSLTNLGKAGALSDGVCVMVCVITRGSGAHGKGFISVRFAWLPYARDCSVPARRLTCPAIAMMVESEVPFSASWVMAQSRRSWKRNPCSPAFLVSVHQAVRQLSGAGSGQRP